MKFRKIIAKLAVVILLVSILVTLGSAAPVGTSETKIVNCAYGWLGVPYVWGGNSVNGVDCSHLVYQVYRQGGAYYPNYLTVAGIKSSKFFVKTTSPRPGDLILWEQNVGAYDFARHVGIYLWNGQFIHASGAAGKVVQDNMYNSKYYPNGIIIQAKPYYVRWNLGMV